jgi:hypothetical protein
MIAQQDRSALFVQTGGYVIGRNWWLSMWGTTPFGQLRIYDDQIDLRTAFWIYHFPRAAIQSLSITRGTLVVGIRIEHTVERHSRLVVFWSHDIHQLVQELETADYPVDSAGI